MLTSQLYLDWLRWLPPLFSVWSAKTHFPSHASSHQIVSHG